MKKDRLAPYVPAQLPEPAKLQRALEEALKGLESKRSQYGYAHDWAAFIAWLAQSGLQIKDVKTFHVQAYLRQMHEASYAKSTRARALAVLRKMFRALVQAEILTVNPAREAENVRVSREPSTPWLSADELKKLLQRPKRASWRTQRDWLVVAMLIGTGLRRAEVAAMRFEDLLPGPTGGLAARVHVKGGKNAVIILPSWLIKEITAWRKKNDAGPIFPNDLLAGDGHSKAISDSTVWRILKRAARLHGVNLARTTPHSIRRSFVTITGIRGASLEDRQAALLHASRVTTERYDKAARLNAPPGELLGDLLPDEDH